MPKTYVLDTSVLLHNPSAFFSFEENDVVIPLVVVEEIDNPFEISPDLNQPLTVP